MKRLIVELREDISETEIAILILAIKSMRRVASVLVERAR